MRRKIIGLVLAATLLAAGMLIAQQNKADIDLQEAIRTELVNGVRAAIDQYKNVIALPGASPEVIARALVRLGGAHEKQGSADALAAYQRVINEFPDQIDAFQKARSRLAAITSRTGGKSLKQICAGADCDGVISPDGRYLVRFDGKGISIREATPTGATREIARAPDSDARAFAWAPDGKRVAYTAAARRAGSGGAGITIHIANVDGAAGDRIVFRGCAATACSALGWSHDGKKLLIRSRSDMLEWVGASEGNVVPPPATAGGAFGRADSEGIFLSPDGQYVAFNANKDASSKDRNVYIMATDGSGQTVVSPSQAEQEAVGWDPDGRLLFAQTDPSSGQVFLWAVPIKSGKPGVPVQVYRFAEGSFPTFSSVTRSGAVYYRTLQDLRDIFIASMDPKTGKVISEAKALPPSRTALGLWSPDGRQILRASRPAGQDTFQGFRIYSPDSGNDQPVASGIELSVMAFCWAPDSASILFNRRAGSQSEPVRFNLSTGGVTPLFPEAAPGNFRAKTCSESLVVDSDAVAITVRNLQTGKPTEIRRSTRTQPTQVNYVPFLSHDGRSVAFEELLQDGSTALFVIPSAGGAPLELARARPPSAFNNVRGIAWSPDDRFVYFFRKSDSTAPFEWFRVPAAGGAEESAGLKGQGYGLADIAPDGKHVVFGANGQQPEIWAIENFLPPAK